VATGGSELTPDHNLTVTGGGTKPKYRAMAAVGGPVRGDQGDSGAAGEVLPSDPGRADKSRVAA
jgi:hypothetical protein